MTYTKATILLSSVNANTGDRITTFHLRFPRIINAEALRHRLFCLSGDTILNFHLPTGQGENNSIKSYKMTLKDFYEKWNFGASPIPYSRKSKYADYSVLEDDKVYSVPEVQNLVKYKSKKAGNLNKACRTGKILNCFKNGRTWYARGIDFKNYRNSMTIEVRVPLIGRLRGMSIRQINEETMQVQTSKVKNVWFSGVKEIYRLKTQSGYLDSTLDHRVFTNNGWKRLEDLDIKKDKIAKVSRKLNKTKKSIQNEKINGKWTAKFNKDIKPILKEEQDNKCKICGCQNPTDIHHIKPVHQRPDLAFEKENIVLICNSCHKEEHSTQGWQKGAKLNTYFEDILSIEFLKTDETFDLEIDGEFHNFTANNYVVHNSVNSASSRAIPNSRLYKMVEDKPFIPDEWTKNQKGMYGTKLLNENDSQKADEVWYDAMRYCLNASEKLSDLGVHKQYVNRLLEPFQYIDLILTATCFENFFKLRIAKDAQPEIKELAELMKEALDNNEPDVLETGEWHIPYLLPEDDELSIEDKILISSARCARVSYRTFDGVVSDVQSDKELAEKLLTSGHLSPFEHIAKCLIGKYMVGNLIGFCSYRKTLENEDNGDINPDFILTNEELKIFFGKNK